MTQEEEIKSQADIYVGHPQDLGEDIGITKMRNAFIKGAKWADKTMIDKACEWLKISVEDYQTYDAWKGDYIDVDTLINDFIKAMEE